MIRALAAATLALTLLPIATAHAEPAASAAVVGDPKLPWLDNEWYKLHLNMRARIGLADFDGLEASQAYTLRTRVGLELKPYYGFGAFAELENTWAIAEKQYWNTVTPPNGKSPIADPENTELNRAWIQYTNDALFESPVSAKLKGGLQRIIFDDQRFIGNVGWRQNEQTFRAGLVESNLAVDGLTTQYAYLWKIQRIFGDQGPTPATRDFDSASNLARIHYGGVENLDVTAFAYLLDFEQDSPLNSANSYGFRVAGSFDLQPDWALEYSGSYAYQTDAGDNPVDYDAHYGWVELGAKWKPVGLLALGYEHLGSDDGRARFVTPLATAHKFNGYADVFLDNGGPRGLQDFFVTLAPTLPWKLKGKLMYHEFWSAQGGTHLGREVDAVLVRPINKYLSALVKGAWFDGDVPTRPDRWRLTFDLTLAY